MEDPEGRNFSGDILNDIARKRSALLTALLIIWRYGRRGEGIKRGLVLGSYEDWGRWVRDALLTLGCRDPVERLSETKTRDPERQKIGELFTIWWGEYKSAPQTAHKLHFEINEIIDPQKRGRQFVASQLEKLTGTRAAGFVLTRQTPVGKWSAATYALTETEDQAIPPS